MAVFPSTLEDVVRSYDIAALMPLIILAGFSLLVLFAGAFFSESVKKVLVPLLALLGTIGAALACVPLWGQGLEFGLSGHALFIADNYALLFNGVFLTALGVTILMSRRFLHPRDGDKGSTAGEFYGLLMLSTIGMMMVSGGSDLLTIFLGIETLSIGVYILAGFARHNLRSNEASLKYFLLGAFATGFQLYGIAMAYLATGSTNLNQIAEVVRGGVVNGPIGSASGLAYFAALALLLIGYGFKAALVPFHQWAPDVYEGSPTPVSAYMATAVKAAAFAAILRVFAEMLRWPEIAAHWQSIVLIISVLTMSIGNIAALMQTSLKRMLGYSSIAHAGYALVGVTAVASALGSGNEAGLNSAFSGVIYYMFIYALMTLGAFAAVIYFEQRITRDDENADLELEDIRGLGSRYPWAAGALTLFLFSLAGIPPTAGFFAKLFVFLPGIQQGLVGLVIVGVINAVISLFYYYRPMVFMYSRGKSASAVQIEASEAGSGEAVAPVSSVGTAAAILICAVAVILMFALQSFILPLLQTALPLSVF